MTTMNNQLIKALSLARRIDQDQQQGALTMAQLKRETGYGLSTLRSMLWALKDAGQLEVVKVPSMRIDGQYTQTVAYRIIENGEVKEG